jgi:hypothetical protein
MSTTGQKARARRIAPQKDEGRIAPSVKYFTQNSMNGAYKRMGQLLTCLPDRREILPRRIVMRTLITALAVTAILATSAVAKTPRTKEVHVQHNNSLIHNAVTRSPTQLNSYCRFDHGETDPDPRIRLQLIRDCREWEFDHAE